MNWTASRAGAPAPVPDEATGAGAAPLAQDERVADGGTDGAGGGADPAEADVAGPDPAVARGASVDELDDVVAHPAARPAAASATTVEYTVRRENKSISFVTFQMTLYRLARLLRTQNGSDRRSQLTSKVVPMPMPVIHSGTGS